MKKLSRDYYRIEKAIQFLEQNFQAQPSLREMAQNINISEYHFHRLFQRWAGVSPKKFLQFLTKEHVKELLKESNVLDSAYAVGLSSPGRLHDLFINWEAMSPGEYKQKALGVKISYGFHHSPLGECFIAMTERGICRLAFIDKGGAKSALEEFRKSWENAKLVKDQTGTGVLIKKIFPVQKNQRSSPVRLLCKGTEFQIKVWEALLRISPGRVATYQSIAQFIGRPKAVRAVGHAVGKNPVAYLIPCHRVIRRGGHLGGYRWGTARKRAILGMEAAKWG